MKLDVIPRIVDKKSEKKRIQREGFIPAAIYVRGKDSETIAIKNSDFTRQIRTVQPGRLSTHIFILVDNNEKERQAILKDIQYNITNYDVIHLDFEELQDNVYVKIKVPIECIGAAECPGVKLGGVLRQVIRTLRVRCLPEDIPEVFQLDVKALGPRESRRLSDLKIPETVRPLADLREVAAVIVKR